MTNITKKFSLFFTLLLAVFSLSFLLGSQPITTIQAHDVIENCGFTCPVIHWTWQTKEINIPGYFTYSPKINIPVESWVCPSPDSAYTSTNSSKPCSRYYDVHGDGNPFKVWRYADKIKQTTDHWTCPSGYEYHNQPGSDKDCRKWIDNTYTTTNHSADVAYNKSADPTKCHRPSDDSLRDDYGMDHDARGDFKFANSEWKMAIPIKCTPVDCVWHWSECSASCGGGTRDVIVDTPAQYGGRACPSDSESCNTDSCSTIRWCFPNDSREHLYYAKAIPSTDKPESGFAWEAGMNEWCEKPASTHRWCEEICKDQLVEKSLVKICENIGYQAIVVPDNEDNPDGKPWETGMDENCEFQPNNEVTGTPVPTPTSEPSNNDGGDSDPGPYVCNDQDPGAPTNLRATALGGGKVRLDWDNAPGPHSSYAVAYGPSIGNYLYGDPNVGNVTTYTVLALDPGGNYCFYVQAQNGCKGGVPSNVVCTNQPGTLRVLGITDNYNPLIDGIKESYGGMVLGASTDELVGTAEVVYSSDKLPSGNTLINGRSLSIPAIAVDQPLYQPQIIADQLAVGQHEVLNTTINGSNVYYGHNGSDVFGSLYKVTKGDQVIVNNNGQKLVYTVTSIDFVQKSNVDSIATDPNQIVLVTCSYTQPDYRIVVKASIQP